MGIWEIEYAHSNYSGMLRIVSHWVVTGMATIGSNHYSLVTP